MGFFKELKKFVSNPVEYTEKNVISPVIETVKDVGSSIDDAVNDVIPGGWGTVAAVTAAVVGAPALLSELAPATFVPEATAATTAAAVPSAFETAIGSALGGTTLGTAGPVGTAGFGTALPAAADVAAGLEAAGFAPGTAANFAGMTAAGVGATNLLGGATALAPVAAAASPISVQQALQGARLINGLLTPQQQATPNLLAQAQKTLAQQGGVDYSTLLGLLSQRAMPSGLLGTQFQPQSINIASLLG